MKNNKIWIFFICIFFISCAGARNIPTWMPTGHHPKYPSEKYLIGIGIAPRTRNPDADMSKADAKARVEIAKQIRVKLEDVISANEMERKEGSVVTSSYDISVSSQENVNMTLEGVEIADRYFDPKAKLHYAIGVLPKARTAMRLSFEAEEGYSGCQKISKEADRLLAKGDMVGSIRKLILAVDLFEKAENKMTISSILMPTPGGIRSDITENPFAKLIELVNDLRFEIVSGDKQEGRIGAPLPEPLSLKVLSKGNAPIAGMPIIAKMSPKDGTAEGIVKSGKDGRASLKILEVKKTGKSINHIRLVPAWEEAVQEALGKMTAQWTNRIKAAEILFQYKLRVEENTKVLIKTCILQDGAITEDTVILPNLVDAFKKAGFMVVNAQGKIDKGRGCPGPDTVKNLAGNYQDKTDIFIMATATADYSSRRGNAFVYRGHLFMVGYDLVMNETLSSSEGDAAGGASERTRAAERTLRQACGDIAPGFVESIREAIR